VLQQGRKRVYFHHVSGVARWSTMFRHGSNYTTHLGLWHHKISRPGYSISVHGTRDRPYFLTSPTRSTNFPYATPQRWRFGTDVMFEKKPGNFCVDKLRLILLYKADFNQNNKFLGRAMMRNAELQKLLAPEQYGSRKKMSAIDQCLNKRLAFDLLRQSRCPAAMCSNDARSCYNQIVHSITSL